MYLGHRALRHQERRQDQGGEQGRDEKTWPALARCGRCVCADLCRSGAGAAEGAPYAAGFLAGDLSGGRPASTAIGDGHVAKCWITAKNPAAERP